MHQEEKKLLTDFLDQLTAVQGVQKDEEASALIRSAGEAQPDSLYLLVQKALLQEQALNGAKAQIAALQRELADARRTEGNSGSFLGQNPWATPAGRAASPGSPQGFTQAPPMSAGGPGAFGASPFGSFLGSAAATAAGVAGGAFLFQGIESLMGHHGGYGFSDTGYMGHGGAENVTINEYYGDSAAASRSLDAGYSDDGNNGFSDVSGDSGWDSYDDNSDSIDV
jgi:hypothetical protein